MKIDKLILFNIGPYRGQIKIDFEELGKIFLVCGKTGSGKTTIFDAICYALYGQAISKREIVSHFAKPDDDVYIELFFTLNKNKWRIWRSPARTVAKKKGTGNTDRPSEAVLYKLQDSEWVVVTNKISEVESTIEKTIGLSGDEFTKIVLLPQGEFQRFLEMSTKDRAYILEKLFPVEIHNKISELARIKSREAITEASSLDEQITQLKASIQALPQSNIDLAQQNIDVAKKKEELALISRDSAKAAFDNADTHYKAWAEYDEALLQHTTLLNSQEQALLLQAKLNKAESALAIESVMTAYKTISVDMRESNKLHAQFVEEMAVLNADKENIAKAEIIFAELAITINKLHEEKGILSARAESWQHYISAQKKFIDIKTKADKASAEFNSLYADDKEPACDIVELSAERSRITPQVELIKEAKLFYLNLLEKTKMKELAIDKEAKAYAKKNIAQEQLLLAELEAKNIETEAAIINLQAQLHEGSPCPVCGSTQHDGINSHVQQSINIDDIKAAMQKLELAKKTASNTNDEYSAAHAVVNQWTEEIERLKKIQLQYNFVSSVEDADSKIQELQRKLKSIDYAIENETNKNKAQVELAKIMADFTTAEAMLVDAKQRAGDSSPMPEIEHNEKTMRDAKLKYSELEIKISSYKKKSNELIAKLDESKQRCEKIESLYIESKDVADKALAEQNFTSKEEWEQSILKSSELSETRLKVKNRASLEIAAATRLDAAKRAVHNTDRPDIAKATAMFEKAQAEYALLRSQSDEAIKAMHILKSLYSELGEAENKLNNIKEYGERITSMSKLLNGEIAGRRLSFKNFVLASYFNAVVQKASVRLNKMSDGRYSIKIAEAVDAKNAFVGLDILVLDTFTAMPRPVSSLSGGEKFLAAISLALGLSEFIVSRAGGISLDSIFIDEGFGTLDDETLDKALAALNIIGSDRIIGIISHVSELKNRINTRIEIIKSRSGSTVKIVK